MTIRSIRPNRVTPIPQSSKPKRQRYNSDAWRRASAEWLERFPFCVLCLMHCRINERAMSDTCGTQRHLIVDHIEPHRGNERLYWDRNNLQTLCRLCHDRDKQSHDSSGRTATQWFELLDKTMREHNARQFIQPGWLPPAIVQALGGVWGSNASNLLSRPGTQSVRVF